MFTSRVYPTEGLGEDTNTRRDRVVKDYGIPDEPDLDVEIKYFVDKPLGKQSRISVTLSCETVTWNRQNNISVKQCVVCEVMSAEDSWQEMSSMIISRVKYLHLDQDTQHQN